ncbi:MAG: EMC3/TMCO1 family protein [Candidatus Micrarchaeia archaeon]
MVDATTTIFAIAVVFSITSNVINRKMGIRKRMKEIQDDMKQFQDAFKKATEKKDESELKKLKAREEQVMSQMQEMMLLPWKSMIIVMPMFFILIGEPFLTQYPGILMETFKDFVIFLPFDIHLDAIFSLQIFKQAAYGTKGFFIVSAIISGITLSIIEQKIEKKK